MKLIFEEPVSKKISRALHKAKQENKKVSCIEVSLAEYKSLLDEFGLIAMYQKPTSMGIMMFGFPLVVDK